VTARAGPELSHPEIRATIARLRQTLSGNYWRKPITNAPIPRHSSMR
jgi:hypothetical protein